MEKCESHVKQGQHNLNKIAKKITYNKCKMCKKPAIKNLVLEIGLNELTFQHEYTAEY